MHNFSFTSVQGKTKVFYFDKTVLPKIKDNNAIYIADKNTEKIARLARNFLKGIPFAVIDPGENHKNFDSLQYILKTALDAGLSRKAVFVGIGGGVVCDLAAFAASIYMRGVSCVLVPTSLLAMADAAIGGKTAVNFQNYKNMIGSFYKADEIYICIQSLKTLPQKQYLSGIAEILKVALLYEPELYRMLCNKRKDILERKDELLLPIIDTALRIKAAVIVKDFTEQGERSFLNFGHSFAHGLESLSGFTITHGQAVAWGICRALRFGQKKGLTDPLYADEVCSCIKDLGFYTEPVPPKLKKSFCSNATNDGFAKKLISAMKNDKKNTDGKIKLILQETLGKNLIYEAYEKEIEESLI